MSIFDHILIVLLVVALPIEGVHSIRRLVADIRAGKPGARAHAYRTTIALQWSLVLALAIAWAVCMRPWADLGFRPGTMAGVAIGIGFLAVAALLLRAQHRAVQKLSDEQVAKFKSRSAETAALLPDTPRDRRLFALMAITAGTCEEILCRGFVFWYLGHFMNPWLSVLAASVAFGLAHAYQGRKGMIRTGIVGGVFGVLFVLTGSLVFPVIGHIAIDMAALGVARRLSGTLPNAVPAPA